MIQASHARKIEFDYHNGCIPNKQQSVQIKRVYKKSNPRKTTLIKIGIGVFAYAVLLVYVCATVSTMGYRMVNLQNDIDKLQDANRMLEYKIAEKVALDRVETVAITKLGMCKPDSSRAIAITVSEPETIQVAVQNPTDSHAGNTNISERSLQKIYNNLMLLAQQR
jgi:cell division protein FtsL